ncbi:hypothetical protein QMK61_03940 [Fulvimonas sp. R45]|uniref:hypothetical protein n=1 Tax=Fulvimonas sp. R45 TaxID=3045937 RepID=UPI00265EF0D5|nr:hypothetical protein [Fulvimonas sp. R45]MDO1527976.1 hypothetical protein [Fulvimonas sp. R45]
MNIKKILFIVILLACHCCFAKGLRPISSNYGICLKGMEGLRITVNGPVDVEFATLFHGERIIGRFEITTLGPTYKLSSDELRRWANGDLVVVATGNDYVGVRKIQSSGGYDSAYVYFRKNPRWVGTPHKIDLMKALSSCDLRAAFNYDSPPKFDGKPTR